MKRQHFLAKLQQNKPSVFKQYGYDLLPEEFGYFDKVALICQKHGVFHVRPGTFLSGNESRRICQECSKENARRSRIHSADEFITRSKSRFDRKFDYGRVEYRSSQVPVELVCTTHGGFQITPKQHLGSRFGCPKCDVEIPRARKLTSALEKAKKIHGNKYDYSRVDFKFVADKVEIICQQHGSFWQSMYDHAVRETGCPTCSRALDKLTQGEFVTKARSIHGDTYDYDKVVYRKASCPVVIGCKVHGYFSQRAASHLSGNGCLKCHKASLLLSREEFISNSRKIHGDTYDYSNVVYTGNKNPVEIICPKHGSFWQKPNSHVSSKHGCRFCLESRGEIAIEKFLKRYGIDYIREYRIYPHRYRFDFYLVGLDIYIEFHGIQHYRPVELFGGQEEFERTRERDGKKIDLVKQMRGSLIVLNYLSLNESLIEKQLQYKLKKIYSRWYLIDGKIRVFKKLTHVYSQFGIDTSIETKDLDNEVLKKVNGASVLF